jgi:hypothetical protein
VTVGPVDNSGSRLVSSLAQQTFRLAEWRAPRLPLEGGLVLKARETWPSSARVYYHRFEQPWPAEAEVIEREPVRVCLPTTVFAILAILPLVLDDVGGVLASSYALRRAGNARGVAAGWNALVLAAPNPQTPDPVRSDTEPLGDLFCDQEPIHGT